MEKELIYGDEYRRYDLGEEERLALSKESV